MSNEHEQHWELVLDRELKKLPDLTAPDTLIPRVLAAIRAQARPWWQRPWATWPRWWRVGFLAFTLTLLAGVVLGLPEAVGYISLQPLVTMATAFVDSFTLLWKPFVALGNACLVLLRSAGQWLLWGLALAGIAVYLVCVSLGTLCYRVAFNKI